MLTHLREADWLTARRVRGYAVLIAIASLALLANSYIKAMQPAGTDFLAFWGAGHVAAAGNPAAAYNLAVQESVQTATGSEGWFVFVNPPPFLFAVMPFGALPFPIAWIAWVAVTYALWAWASIRAFPRLWPLILAYPGALLAAGHAQTGLLTGALLVLAAHWLAQRPVLSGAAIGALVVKPHLAVLTPFWLAMGGQWRAIVAAGASVLGLLAASWLVFGTDTMAGYTTSWEASRAIMGERSDDFFLRMVTLYSQVRHWTGEGPAMVAGVLSGLAALAAAMLAWRKSGGDVRASASAMLAATALASPYLFNYDLPFLIFPTLWLVEQGLERGFRPYEKLGLVALWFSPYATRAAALPLEVNFMPLCSLALLWLVWTRAGQR
ncbi:glycosyltransferase family 87 protein [Qipengyuania gaetbuli]|uniref:glycosyltransferase family 87 protein n=1 Tax=Qipengyuania gaetbuli TaxID=266952 RepID=UPI001CFED46D|nr:glycosyltransferase family 87 protein [Qipengyuania gaetbuli]